ACTGRHQHRYSARLSELQGRCRVLVDECLFNGRLVRHVVMDDGGKPVMQLAKTCGEIRILLRTDGARPDETERVAEGLDNAPAGAPKARINTDDTNRFLHVLTLG